MAQPITWRNVDAPQSGGAFQGMALAGQNINAGFDKLNGVLDQQKAIEEANWQTGKTNNTQAFLNEIAKYRTPEELAAAQASGAFDQLRQQYGAQVDQAQIRSAQDGREAVLQNRVTANNAFQDSTSNFAAKPFKEQAAAKYAAGDKAGGDAILAAHPEITDTAALVKAGFEGDTAKNARALSAALQPGVIPNAVATQTAETRKLAEDARVAEEAKLTLSLNKRLLTESAAYNDKQTAIGKEMGKLAFALSLPVDKSGIPKFGDLTPDQRKSFNEMLFAKKLPSIESYATGDTAAADALHGKIAASGEYPASFVEANKANIRGALDSTKNTGSVGNSAEARNATNAQNEAVINLLSKSTWSVPGSPNALRSQDDIRGVIKDMVEPDKQVSANKAIQTMLTKGIQLKDGSYVVPSVEDIKGALGSTSDGWGLDGWGGGGITGDFGVKLTNNLKERMNTSDFTKQRENMARVDAFNLRRDAANIYSKPAVVTPFTNNK